MPISGSLPRSGLSQHIFHAVQNIKKVSDISVGERKQNRDHDDIDVGVIDAICWHFFSLPSASWRNRQLLTTRKRHIRDMQTWRRSPCTIGKNAIFMSTRVFKAAFKLWTPTFQSFTIDSFVCYFRSKIDVQSSSGANYKNEKCNEYWIFFLLCTGFLEPVRPIRRPNHSRGKSLLSRWESASLTLSIRRVVATPVVYS